MRSKSGLLYFRQLGVQVSLQDAGRVGYAAYGIPESGFMDAVSANRANLLLGNPVGKACLEFYQGMATMEFTRACQVAFSGAPAQISVNTLPYQMQQVITLQGGDTIEVSVSRSGNWLYMALAGDWDQPTYFGSKSFYQPISGRSGFRVGDEIAFFPKRERITSKNAYVKPSSFWHPTVISAYPGPDFELLDLRGQEQLLGSSFQVTTSINRMGYQLEGSISHALPEILSAPVYPGTVQLTPSGRLIVLMRDAQVTGGYPRVLQLTPRSLAAFSQKRPGEYVSFQLA
ncbi:MAG: biotin-dependent carboxyltransferase family protein [Lunatimonas sp.]|uniref:5-oxoprolinase subunit C family protein n=1 Tax=Lunatimonas sp. TaxID=2060141 RepID=UPI00263AD777|nr:biotin-dependent carboxyltransferase family protein [Lunatimonas sp.]MCC5939520.1 biotin-dependent carboxyltransferase family protein [Lunatimonas sp.]